MTNNSVKIKILLLLSIFLCSHSACEAKKDQYPFQDTTLSLEKRVDDLISRLTLEEKVSQMQNHSMAIDHLGIPEYNWWNECLHGVGRSGHKVTVFPQAIALAATFDKEAIFKVGDITSTEARAIYNQSFINGKKGQQYQGLTFWTPNINIFRDPRWGRGQETYGEDPYLTSVIGKEMVWGLQGGDSLYLKVSACAKHFAVHSGPEKGRHSFNTSVSDYDLWDTYLPAFKELVVNAKVSSVMCAYNRFDDEPCCGNSRLMTDILRNQWKFKGYVTSDCGAIDDFYTHHKTHSDAASASADAVLNGTDLDCGEHAYKALVDAVKKGLIDESAINNSIRRLFMTRFRLGMFDPVEASPYAKIKFDTLECDEHKKHALKMATESIVLLKNKGHLLPLSSKIKKIAVVGPNANDDKVQLGNYNGFPSKIITPLKGIKAFTGIEVVYAKATGHTSSSAENIKAALEIIKDADLVIYVGGITPRLEGEEGDAGRENVEGFKGGDRTSIALPKVQTDFMKQIKAKGLPLVFICMSGSAIGFEWEAANADAILQAWYGGQSSGEAIADILFGKYNPSGHLPLTFYKKDKDLPDYFDYAMTNRTYRYFNGEPLYPFGYGLSYTTFSYQWTSKPKTEYSQNDEISCSMLVKNTGNMEGEEVIQTYIQYPEGKGYPLKELKSFEKITLASGKKRNIEISIPVNSFAKWSDTQKKLIIPKGIYKIWMGSHSEDKKIISSFRIQ
ncbi:glycoside hydrolase family 3 C-terminal domain-containing protein [Dysgonomonas sp. HGC4]|nr:glycoside hydrolase family 3 C-terminal domain-containing protein [Dysgonomonas sp. HGC4]MBD8347874.1 glycoside hydrolase family 3 C-terminal domain-containing protein [Dysgonomonas sp. HGC4]